MTDPHFLDASGLLCPLPVLKARKRLSAISTGSILEVLANDPAAVVDFPHFCNEAGHEMIDIRDHESGGQVFVIRKHKRK